MSLEAISNFAKTVKQLQLFCATPVVTDRDRAGIIQAFEFTYEQSWKSIQKLAAPLGHRVAAPKTAFQVALQMGWILIQDEPLWIKMIEDRNLTSHTYREEVAKEILERIQGKYLGLFNDLLSKLSNEAPPK